MLVSIVCPVYNAEKYLVNCINSIQNQTHSETEMIFVDDRSTDGTYELLKQYEKKDDHIRVYQNDHNRGSTYTRNFGVKMSEGEWFLMLDADDELKADAIETMLQEGIRNNSDIVLSDYETVDKNGNVRTISTELEERVYSSRDIAERIFSELPINVLCCIGNKLYKNDFVRNRKKRTPDVPRTGGDMMFIMDSLLSNARVAYIKKSFYRYYQRENSISHSYRPNMYDDMNTTRNGIKELMRKYELFEEKQYLYEQNRYGLVYWSLLQETWKGRQYSDYKNAYDEIVKDDRTQTTLRIMRENEKNMRRRIILRAFGSPLALYGVLKMRSIRDKHR